MIESGFTELKNDLKSELKDELMKMEKIMDRSFAACNDGIRDLRGWVKWIVGTVVVGVMFKVVIHDRYMEDKLMVKIIDSGKEVMVAIRDSEAGITTMVQNTLLQLKLELRMSQQDELLADDAKKKKH
ncbi:hypothetical protein HOY82DRAFT_590703 [Tuber indicum]|nr:hypothetical protein HOY82DRAFT_590703 [Tuber indicum]